MKIGIDARILAHPKCGISTYISNLVTNLLTLDSDLKIFLFSDSEFHSSHEKISSLDRVTKVIFASSKKEKKHWAQKFLPQKLREYQIDIYHATWNNAVPFFRRCPCILTIHDLAPWILGSHFKNKRKEIRYKLRQFFCAHWADFIITDSKASEKDIVRLCKVKENKIDVIYLGVNEEFVEDVDESIKEQALLSYNLLGKNYIIDPLGIDHPRRNAIFVLEGFFEILRRGFDFYLVYTGNFYREGIQFQSLLRRIKELDIQNRVVITGWVPTDVLKVLLRNAYVSVIPSLYEGFGLPILESFASGVPVIATNRGSIPEVVGDAGILVDAYNFRDLADRVEEIIRKDGLRKELIEKGKERVKLFSWKSTAINTLNVYKRILSKYK
ncbi:MAG: glycosyltransferase family 4 protein [Candidatus Omnitrophica bacterium]|nr:glycosyltransferase family 4 protein [Candidatus Omnitrophota bacterium]